jgi:hypothetical protein
MQSLLTRIFQRATGWLRRQLFAWHGRQQRHPRYENLPCCFTNR